MTRKRETLLEYTTPAKFSSGGGVTYV